MLPLFCSGERLDGLDPTNGLPQVVGLLDLSIINLVLKCGGVQSRLGCGVEGAPPGLRQTISTPVIESRRLSLDHGVTAREHPGRYTFASVGLGMLLFPLLPLIFISECKMYSQ